MHKLTTHFLVLIVCFLLLITAGQCLAYSSNIGKGIRAGQDLAYSSDLGKGIRAGGFMVYPQLRAGMEYKDNIYATKTNKESDWIAVLGSSILGSSTWSRHALNLRAGMTKGFYLEESDENYLNVHAMAGGRLDIVGNSYFDAGAGYENFYEDRGSPDAQAAWKEPSRYERLSASGLLHHGAGAFFIDAGGDVADYRYKKVDLMDGGSDRQEDRDRMEYVAQARFGYELNPIISPFVAFQYNWRRYDNKQLAQRDSEGYRVGAGAKVYMGGITTGEISGGYLKQDYDAADNKDISSAYYGLGLTWEMTPLTTFNADVIQTIKETTMPDASGISGTDVTLSVKHALLRNLSLGLGLSYIHDDYEGIDLTDKYYAISPHISYSWNRHLGADLGYQYRHKNSNMDKLNREYAVNQIMFSITGAF